MAKRQSVLPITRDGRTAREPATTTPHVVALRRLPRPPERLDDVAAGVWRDIGRRLVDARLLTMLDLPALARYCHLTSLARDCERVIASEGRTLMTSQGRGRNPEVVTWEHANIELRRLESRLGLSALDRQRLKVQTIAPSAENDTIDRLILGPRNA